MRARRRTPLYDQKVVAEKLKRAAFYSQVRVIVIGGQATSSESGLRRSSHTWKPPITSSLWPVPTGWCLHACGRCVLRSHSTALAPGAAAFPYRQWLFAPAASGSLETEVLNSQELPGLFHLAAATQRLAPWCAA